MSEKVQRKGVYMRTMFGYTPIWKDMRSVFGYTTLYAISPCNMKLLVIMVTMDGQQYVWGIAAAAILIPLIGVIIRTIWNWSKTSKVGICLKVPLEILNTGTKWGLLHVRDGKDEFPDKGPILHKVYWFKEIDRRGTLKASVRHTKKLGFQFKCFADYRGIDFNKLKEVLEKSGYLSVGEGAGKQGRAWFIHPDYPTYKTADKIENNFFYPE